MLTRQISVIRGLCIPGTRFRRTIDHGCNGFDGFTRIPLCLVASEMHVTSN